VNPIAYVLWLVAYAIFAGTILIALLLFLRSFMTWVGANPFGRFSYNLTRITEPLVQPIRSQFGGRYMRYDVMPLIMGVMVLVTGIFIANSLWRFAMIVGDTLDTLNNARTTPGYLIRQLILTLGLLYVVAIFLRFFLPFFNIGYRSKFMRFIFAITEPLLKPLRRIFVVGMFDLSPLVAMFIVQVLTEVVANQVG
jgi:uncharacterized protein YggT (Ycf19 family)